MEIVAKTDDPEPAALPVKGKGKEKEVVGEGSAAGGDSEGAQKEGQVDKSINAVEAAATNLFDKLSLSTAKLQQTIQSSLANPALHNTTQLREQLAQSLQLSHAKENLQMSRQKAEKLAEEYLKKGDQWVKDAEKWMGEAVKIVPPEDGDTRIIATSWDGADFYSFSTSPVVPASSQAKTGRSASSTGPAPLVAGSRKEALLTRLREDKDLLLVNPEGDGESPQRQADFRDWVKNKWPSASKEKEVALVGAIRMELGRSESTRHIYQTHISPRASHGRTILAEIPLPQGDD